MTIHNITNEEINDYDVYISFNDRTSLYQIDGYELTADALAKIADVVADHAGLKTGQSVLQDQVNNISKVVDDLAETVRNLFFDFTGDSATPTNEQPVGREMTNEEKLIEAAVSENIVAFSYDSGSGPEIRTLKVQFVDGNLVGGFDTGRQGFRHFRLDRIIGKVTL